MKSEHGFANFLALRWKHPRTQIPIKMSVANGRIVSEFSATTVVAEALSE